MFKLDESFLEELGLQGMPEEQKGEFLKHVQEELEVKVGERIAEGMSEEQMDDFEKILDGDQGAIDAVLTANENYKSDTVYRLLVDQNGYADGAPETLQEYASMRWLMRNKPNHAEVVTQVIEELKEEIRKNKDGILGAEA